jgi:hypothetical protein
MFLIGDRTDDIIDASNRDLTNAAAFQDSIRNTAIICNFDDNRIVLVLASVKSRVDTNLPPVAGAYGALSTAYSLSTEKKQVESCGHNNTVTLSNFNLLHTSQS